MKNEGFYLVTGSSENLVDSLSSFLTDKGVQLMECHPADGIRIAKLPPKSDRGGKYSWEGLADMAQNKLEVAVPALNENNPNYVDEERDENDTSDLVVREIEVSKAVEEEDGEGVGWERRR